MSMTTKCLTLLFLLGTSLLIGSQANADLIVNGSFEMSNPGDGATQTDANPDAPQVLGWTNTGDVVKSDVDGSSSTTLDGIGAQDGDNAFQLQAISGNDSVPRTSGMTSDFFTVTAPDEFLLSAFFATRAPGTNSDFGFGAFSLDLLDAAGDVVTPTSPVDPDLVGGTYVEFRRTYTDLAAGQYQVQLVASSTNNTNLQQGTVDNISFVSTTATGIPEPTSVALLGLGGALIMIRRRR